MIWSRRHAMTAWDYSARVFSAVCPAGAGCWLVVLAVLDFVLDFTIARFWKMPGAWRRASPW